MSLAPLKAVALLVFLGAVAGATYGVQTLLDVQVSDGGLSMSPAHERLAAAPGQSVTFPVKLTSRAGEPTDARLVVATEPFAGNSSVQRVAPGLAQTLFVTVTVPADATPGSYKIGLRAETPAGERLRERGDVLRLDVLAPGRGFQDGDAVNITYTGRLTETGTVFFTNDPALATASFPRVDGFRPATGSAEVRTKPTPNVVPGLLEGMLGMQVGETRSILVTPEKGFGAGTLEEREARDERIERSSSLPVRVQSAARDTFATHLRDSGQGDVSNFSAGDLFYVDEEQTGNRLPYAIVALTESEVRYRFAPQIGENYTIHLAWPNASAVTSINETTVVFTTTPTTAPGEPITMRPHWPDMSALVEVTDAEIVVRHSPAIGTSHEERDPFSPTPRRLTVKELTDTEIVYAYPSSNPLAGKILTFDVTIVSMRS